MHKSKLRIIVRGLAVLVIFTVFFALSKWLAPVVAGQNGLNPYYYLSWGAPAIFHEDIDDIGAIVKLEPWRLLGLQIPAFAGIRPADWDTIAPVDPPLPPSENPPVFPAPSGTGVVAIYHSHASEAFAPTAGENRSTDFSQTVVELGNVIESILVANGIQVVHSEEYHDLEYNQSYVRSRETVKEMLKQEAAIMVLMDIHRDGVGTTSANARAVTTCTIEGKKAGQILFVIGTAHENWQRNNRIANDLHNLLENKYPGLSRGILSRENSAYNQDLHPGAILVEVGGHWNTLEESIYGAELFANVLVDYYGGGD